MLCSQVMADLHTLCYGAARDMRNRLSASISAADTTLTFDFDLQGINEGARLAIGDEIMYVWSVNSTAKTAIVQRAEDGSTAAAHAAGQIVLVNSRFTQFDMRNALLAEIRSWGSNIFYPATTKVENGNNVLTVPLPAGYQDAYWILEARDQVGSQEFQGFPMINNLGIADVDHADFPTGRVLRLATPHFPTTMQLTFALPIRTSSFLDAETIESKGLDACQTDIAVFGAASRLLLGVDIQRSDSQAQGEARRAEELPAGFGNQISEFLAKRRDKRFAEEVVRLQVRYPMRKTN